MAVSTPSSVTFSSGHSVNSDSDSSSLATTVEWQVCRRYFNGCCKSKDCLFAHEVSWDKAPDAPDGSPRTPLRIRADVRTLTRKEVAALTTRKDKPRAQRKEPEICQRYARGLCKSNPCRFKHVDPPWSYVDVEPEAPVAIAPESASRERYLETPPNPATFLRALGVDDQAFKIAQAVPYTD